VAVIGLGKAGCWHLERFGLRSDFSTVVACDECPDAARHAAGLAPRIVVDRREFLRDPHVELVLIATPPATHASLAIEALSAGKHVVVETPVALNQFETDAILEAERRSGRSVIVAHQRRWDSDFQLARECLIAGEIGPPTEIKFVHWQYSLEASRTSPGASPAGTVPGLPRKWRDDPHRGGGTLWEFGTHLFDQLLLLVGEAPVSVFARLQAHDTSAVDTGFQAYIQFPSGLTAQIEFNRGAVAPLETGWVIAADKGSYARRTQFTLTEEGEIVDVPLTFNQPPEGEFHAAVARHLRGEIPNPVPIREARLVIALIEAARRSAACGLPVAVAD
jgi:predicted dehydrogenase